MKKTILTIFAIIAIAINIQAEEYEVLTKDGKKYIGELVERTESSITLYNRYTLQKTCFLSSEIIEATSAQGSRFTVEGGKIIGLSYEDRLIQKNQEEKRRMGNPNYAIGKAFKSSGSIALGIGISSFIVGSILVGYGHYEPNQLMKMNKDLENGKKIDYDKYGELVKDITKNGKLYNDCAVTGVVFMSMGGAMTIIGIPLYVHGKRIMDLSLQINENGAGVAFSL